MNDHAAEEWERQEGESEESWEAFQRYRDQTPPRSIRNLSKEVGKGRSILGEWSKEHRWVARVAAWDREQDRVKRDASLKAQIEMGERHAREAMELQEGLLMPARELMRRWKKRKEEGSDGDPFKDLSDLDLIKEAVKAARVFAQVGVFERLTRGLPTTNIGGHEGGPLEIQDHRARVEQMPRGEIEEYLLGVGPAAEAVAQRHGLPRPPVMASDN
jgi:hypothetical protein